MDKTGFVGALKPRVASGRARRSREELADKMRDAVADIPGMVASFSQPIQCRIDELVAGTRAQVIVKLFGDDLQRAEAEGRRDRARCCREVRGRRPTSSRRRWPGSPTSPCRSTASRSRATASTRRRARPDRDGGRRQARVAGLPGEPGVRHRHPVPATSTAGRSRRCRGLLVDAPGGAAAAAVASSRSVEVQEGPVADQPRERPAAHRHRDERRRPRHRQLRARGAAAAAAATSRCRPATT